VPEVRSPASAEPSAMSAVSPQSHSPHPVIQASLEASGQRPASQRCLLSFIYDLRAFSSLVEVGCGQAGWLHAGRRLGAGEIRGYDFPGASAEARGLTTGEFVATDLNEEIRVERKFDLAICMEAAARLPRSAAATLIRSLTGASDWVLFGAALPHQGGLDHVNENWMEYWAALFAQAGFLCYDILRPRFWHDARVAFYYRQSSCLYVRPGSHYALRARGHTPSSRPPSLIHPEMFLKVVGSAAAGGGDLAAEIRQYYRETGGDATPSAAAMPHADQGQQQKTS
jgi:hypothetical protein